ncbi:MAG TPA: RDD family protein [Candidatus Dormibacteraeota bacterium]|nr:RDD family protein [Candidatus Dormibacteraeota bacterium]
MTLPPLPPEGPSGPPETPSTPAAPAPGAETPAAPPPATPGAPAPATAPGWGAPVVEEEPVPAGFHLGGFFIRVAAYIVDAVLVLIIPFVLGTLAGLTGEKDRTIGASVLIVAALIAYLAYFPYFWTRGATPGMRLFGLRVVDAETMDPISGGQAVLRLIGLWLSFLVVYLGVLWVLIDNRKQGWHDKLAGTLVLRRG